MPQTLLLLNGSHSDIPLIFAARKLGFKVITSGNDPTLIGHRYSDHYHAADYSDPDAMLRVAKKHRIDAVCACANDFGALSAAYVAERLSLPGHDRYETALTLHHKDRFKVLAAGLGVRTQAAVVVPEADASTNATPPLALPLIVKPVDLTGGKGITVVQDARDYPAAVRHARVSSPSGRVVAEPWFEGSLHSFSTFLRAGRVIAHFSDNEYTTVNPYLVSSSAAPAINAVHVAPALITTAERMTEALQLVDGVLHFQYLANGDDYTILEVTRRCSGDLHPLPISRALRVDWPEWIVRAEAGLDLSTLSAGVQQGFHGRHCIMSFAPGIVEAVEISPDIRDNIVEELSWWRVGDQIRHCQQHRLGVVQLHYVTLQEMLDKTPRLPQLISVQLRT